MFVVIVRSLPEENTSCVQTTCCWHRLHFWQHPSVLEVFHRGIILKQLLLHGLSRVEFTAPYEDNFMLVGRLYHSTATMQAV